MKMYSELMRKNMKKCNTCNKQRNINDFSKKSYIKKDGTKSVRPYCKDCEHSYRRDRYKLHRTKIRERANYLYNNDPKYKEKRRNEGLRQLYGITLNEYNLMKKKQKGCCSICGIHESKLAKKRLYVDHDHKTNTVRELLCNLCNVGLGAFNEDINKIKLAIDYLSKHKN